MLESYLFVRVDSKTGSACIMVENKGGKVRFSAYLPRAGTVELAGDFTDWDRAPIRMREQACGWWEASVALEPGDYAFQYVVDGVRRMPDYAASGIMRDERGDWVSLLHIPDVSVVRRARAEHRATA